MSGSRLLEEGFCITPGRTALVTLVRDPKNPDFTSPSEAAPRESGSSEWSL